MKKNISIQLKAAFLLAVFSLNMLVGFACSIGVDMGFNSARQKREVTAPATHVHANGKKHQHHQQPAKAAIHVHANGKKHTHHNQTAKLHQEENKPTQKEKDDCCNDKVIKFQSLDKAINQNTKASIDVPALVAIITIFSRLDIYKLSKAYPPKYKARFFYPPPPDIRIAIQSFQI